VDNLSLGSLVVLLEEQKRTTARSKDFNTEQSFDSVPTTGKCYCWGFEVLVVQDCSLCWILVDFG